MNSSFLLIIGATIFWGLWGFFGKLSAMRIGGQGSFWNALSLIITNLTFLLLIHEIPPLKIDRGGIIAGIAAGVFSSLASVFFYLLLKKQPGGWTTAVISLYPLITLILSMIFLKESLTAPRFAGLIFAFLGLIFLNL